MAFVKRRIKFLTLVTAGLLLLSGLAFSSFAFGSRQAVHASAGSSGQGFYQQTNLVSDIAGVALFTDTNLVNPWGLSLPVPGGFRTTVLDCPRSITVKVESSRLVRHW